jgi:hypothetical protein
MSPSAQVVTGCRPFRLMKVNSESKSFYDCRFTASYFFLALNPVSHKIRIFLQLYPCGHSPYVTSSLTRKLICLAFCQVYVPHIWHVTEKSSFFTIHKSFVTLGFAKIILILRILCYNGNLVT